MRNRDASVIEVRQSSRRGLTRSGQKLSVMQYLKGYNSAHGILVLFRLDDKTWNIPGGGNRQPFSALVEYLQTQANRIRDASEGIAALHVIGIDCLA